MPIGFVDVPRAAARLRSRGAPASSRQGELGLPDALPSGAGLHDACRGQRSQQELGVGINQQTFHLFPKMREVDELLRSRPRLKRIVYEAHPELAFARMNGGRPVLSKKRKPDGYAERRRLLAAHGFGCPVERLAGAARDDILDAIAVCRTALLITQRKRRASARRGRATARACR